IYNVQFLLKQVTPTACKRKPESTRSVSNVPDACSTLPNNAELEYCQNVSVAKILNQKEQNEFLDSWKSPKDISDKFPYYVSGFDVEKRPVFVFEVGKWPLHYFVEKGGQDLENLSTYLNKFFRRVEIGPKAFFNESEIGAPDTVVIVDWEDFSLKQLIHAPTVQYILHHFTSFQRLQDSLAYGYYLNVNAVASQFIALAKPILGSALER
ncbi:unnamed protein product, partial [Allacma fusca]